MKKLLILLVFIVLTNVFAFAQSSVWKISKGASSLYIGGSVHILRTQDFPLPKEFDIAFDKSDILVFEADINEANNPEVVQKMLQYMMLPEGKTLKTVLRQKTYKLLEEKCKELGLPIKYMENFTPFSIANVLFVAQIGKLGFMAQGVDEYYFNKAVQSGKKTEFFETIEFQMKLFNDFGMIGDEYVLQSIDELDSLKDIMPSLIAEWRNGTSKTTDETQQEMRDKFPNLYKAFVLDRNKQWLALIEKYLTTKNTEFIIVGLGHVQSGDGLLKSLKEKGYKVEQVK
ncbi:MAG: TraB/GumN family protein [Campylobacteraceae bacterium]|jgi:uncharacterized protein YbaP (TraB family)|nr:TraB/GumN family protein [Campylobacteraceae bacterium]